MSSRLRRGLLGASAFAVVTGFLTGPAGVGAGTEGRAGTIAFVRDVGTGSSLFTIKPDGSGLRRLTPVGSGVSTYKWSPDQSRIAYLDDRSALWLMRPNGTRRRLLAASTPSRSRWFLRWSPDGKAIAVLAQDRPAAFGSALPANNLRLRHLRITVIPTGGGPPRRLPTGDVNWFAWSPRGDEIAYVGKDGAWVISSDGSDRHPLHVNSLDQPSWSPDGKHLGFVGCRVRSGRCVARYGAIYAADADGSHLHVVTEHAYNEYGFAWSPDGRTILYGRENREGIYVIGVDGRNNHRLTRDSPRGTLFPVLAWSPDGRSIAYATTRTGNGDLYLIDADGHDKVRLTSSAENDFDPSWASG
jgi:Tol biopolymer transport system component